MKDIFSEKQFTIKDVYDILARYEFSPYSVDGQLRPFTEYHT